MTGSRPDMKKGNVFIIDDDKFLLDMYSLKFGEKGFDVDVAFGAGEALEKLNGGAKPDVILLDIVMPTMDGFELLTRIKKENLAPESVIIILSNLGQQEDVDKGVELGADGYIIKASSTPSEVVQKVVDIVSKEKPIAGAAGSGK